MRGKDPNGGTPHELAQREFSFSTVRTAASDTSFITPSSPPPRAPRSQDAPAQRLSPARRGAGNFRAGRQPQYRSDLFGDSGDVDKRGGESWVGKKREKKERGVEGNERDSRNWGVTGRRLGSWM